MLSFSGPTYLEYSVELVRWFKSWKAERSGAESDETDPLHCSDHSSDICAWRTCHVCCCDYM
jgi:hypothetical protein